MIKRIFMAAVIAVAVSCVAQAADFDKIPDATKNMKVGQWVMYKIMGGVEQKQSVSAVEGEGEDRIITLKFETIMGGNVINSDEQKINLRESKAQEAEARAQNPDVEITEEQVTVNGKTYNAIVMTATIEGTTTKTYMSEEVPVTGLIKVEVSGMGTMMELVDFGN